MILLRNRDEKERTSLISRLEMPVKGKEAEDGVWSAKAQADAFDAAMAKQSKPDDN